MTRICFVGVDNYRMLHPETSDLPVNGEAVQQVLLARAFKSLGFDVTTVVRAIGEDIDATVDGIRALSAFRWDAGIPVLRFFHPRATGLFAALNSVDADVYYQSPASVLTGLTAAYCRWKHKTFIFRVASDVDCVPGQQLIQFWRDRKFFEYGLRRADLITVQSKYQQELLRQHYGLASTVVNMAVELPERAPPDGRDLDVLWVSNLKAVKRAEIVLELARRLPDVRFTMIGGVTWGEEDYYDRIEHDVSGIANVDFLGRIPYRDVNDLLARSKLFLNTSAVEGYPNTFLQAWVRSVPVVSFFDPDGIISREELGRSPSTVEEMSAAIRELLDDNGQRERIGRNARNYAAANFSPTAGACRYVELCGL